MAQDRESVSSPHTPPMCTIEDSSQLHITTSIIVVITVVTQPPPTWHASSPILTSAISLLVPLLGCTWGMPLSRTWTRRLGAPFCHHIPAITQSCLPPTTRSSFTSVNDYLSWETQFCSFFVVHQLKGMIDGSIPIPTEHIIVSPGTQQPNPIYSWWIRVNQLVYAWLFATISKDNLVKVHDLKCCLDIWHRLESQFNTTSLACALEHADYLNWEDYLSSGEYLHAIKSIADSLVAIQSLVSNLERI